MKNEVSVIIPVFNAEKFIEYAVKSALEQAVVKEVILVEDNSSDNSYSICEKLRSATARIKLIQHGTKENMGAGASRNLGMELANSEYIAFLDADDYYLPNRFKNTFKLFQMYNSDAVFEMVGAHFENVNMEQIHVERLVLAENPVENGPNTMLRIRNPENVFEALIAGGKGWIHLNGLTLKKSLLSSAGLFDENLKFAQDSEFILRCSFYGKLSAGDLGISVAMRRVHQTNRITTGSLEERFWRKSSFHRVVFENFYQKQIPKKLKMIILARYIESFKLYFTTKGLLRKTVKALLYLYVFISKPKYLFLLLR